jgi:K+-sensing histidine kinase KdpD
MRTGDDALRRRLRQLKHDLVSPLTTIHGQLDLLIFKEKHLSPEGRERVRKAVHSCDQILRLLENLEQETHQED